MNSSIATRSIKDMVKDNQQVVFVRYFDSQLWYQTEAGDFEFPVPVSDVGNATLPARDKAILYMRYMRKHLENSHAGALPLQSAQMSMTS